MRQFKSGFSRIVKGSEYPIIPAYIGGAWGSILSYYHGRLASRLPNNIPYPVTIVFGEPMPTDSTPQEVRLRVQELSCGYYEDKKPNRKPLAEMAIRTARKNWRHEAMAESSGRRLTFGKGLTGAVALAHALAPSIKD